MQLRKLYIVIFFLLLGVVYIPQSLMAAPPSNIITYDPKPVPSTSFLDEEGFQIRLQDFKGQAVVLNFWATWCPPCVEEMPALDRLAHTGERDGIRVVAVSQDLQGLSTVKRFYSQYRIGDLEAYADIKAGLFRDMGVQGLPTTVFINTNGEEVARVTGFVNWDDPEIRAFIKSLQNN